MMVVGFWSLWARYKGRLYNDKWLHGAGLLMAPSGIVAIIAGWITTEVGRQPYTVYGLMRTSESASPLAASAVGTSLLIFIVIYFAVFGAGIMYLLKLMYRPPEPGEKETDESGPIRTGGITAGKVPEAQPAE